MRASKLTDAQKAFIIKQGESGIAVAEICCKAGISQATYSNWKKRYGVKEAVREWGMSIRRACSNLLLDTSTFHCHSRRPDQAALKERIKEICETRVRYGYRRVHVILRREGWFVNQKKVRRLYNELGLQLRNKHPKRKVRAKLIRDRQ